MLVITLTQDGKDDAVYLDGGNIVFTLLSIKRNRISVGIEAPKSMTIDRKSVHFDKLNRPKSKPKE